MAGCVWADERITNDVITMRRQRGVALVALLAIIAMGAMYFIYAALNANTASAAVERSKRDSQILQQAKAALIGQIALQAANSAEPNPGRLPCPESLADAGKVNEGLPANATVGNPFGYCGAGGTVVGRLPWKALGLEKLQDTATEPLWYAVAPSWTIQAVAGNTTINSDTPALGGLTSTTGEDAIAVIFAPGQALPGQARLPVDATSAPLAAANYLDMQNAALGGVFANTGPADTFNDHVITLSRAELMPEIEAAVADRFARQIAPGIQTAYSTAPWTVTPTLPFAGAFADPSTATYKGTNATQGLLPVTYSSTSGAVCNVADPRCDPTFVAWNTGATTFTRTGGANYQSHTCSASGTPSIMTCTIHAWTLPLIGVTSMTFNMTVRATNVGNALRQIDPAVVMTGAGAFTVNSATMNTDASATVAFSSSFPAANATLVTLLGGVSCALLGLLCYDYTIDVPIRLLADHAILNAGDATYNWFFRNSWQQFSYYTLAAGVAPSQPAARGCTTGTDCLTANYLSDTSYAGNSVRGLVIMAGRQLGVQTRPNATLSNYLEDVNATASGTYVARSPTLASNRAFNDRIVVIDHN
jgi:hypothetical protein